jgi:DNA-binding beta-propeller fold protein YncE
VIDGKTNSTTTVTDPNARGPVALSVDSFTNRIYIANSGSANVTVISGEKDGNH